MIPRMPDSYYAELQVRLRHLLEAVAAQMAANQVALISGLIDKNELGVALQFLSDGLAERRVRLPEAERREVARLAELMGLDPSVARQVGEQSADL